MFLLDSGLRFQQRRLWLHFGFRRCVFFGFGSFRFDGQTGRGVGRGLLGRGGLLLVPVMVVVVMVVVVMVVMLVWSFLFAFVPFLFADATADATATLLFGLSPAPVFFLHLRRHFRLVLFTFMRFVSVGVAFL